MTSDPHGWRNSTIAGASAGFVSSVVTCPLDVIKTRLQAQKIPKGRPEYLGVSATTRAIVVKDGIRGLYRGLGPTMLGYLPTWAIYFTMYDGVKDYLAASPTYSDGHHQPWSVHILASVTAGATSTVCTSPLWVVKTRFMTQPLGETSYRNTFDAFRIIYHSDGLKAFYRGLVPSLFGVTHVVVQFPLYEYLKDWYSHRLNVAQSELPTYAILFCTTISKSVASLITYPHEVVRTRLQIARRKREVLVQSHDYRLAPIRQIHSQVPLKPPDTTTDSAHSPSKPRGTVAMIAKILHRDGWRGFYKGLGVNLVRTIPNSAMTLLTYEMVMRFLNNSHETHTGA